MARRRVDVGVGRAALARWAEGGGQDQDLATAVRFTLEELAARAPGGSVEIRVPPYGAAQCIEGTHHSRGTPPNVIEMEPETWLRLAVGGLAWEEALDGGRVQASGTQASLDGWLPLFAQDSRGPGGPT